MARRWRRWGADGDTAPSSSSGAVRTRSRASASRRSIVRTLCDRAVAFTAHDVVVVADGAHVTLNIARRTRRREVPARGRRGRFRFFANHRASIDGRRPTDRPIDRSTDRPTDRSIDRSIDRSTARQAPSRAPAQGPAVQGRRRINRPPFRSARRDPGAGVARAFDDDGPDDRTTRRTRARTAGSTWRRASPRARARARTREES
tara:strand:- start:8407 stop:9018 length:612 start_codon:yes stop_codon:yes gene_type:complete